MVPKVDTNGRLDKTLRYNEQKVAQGMAELILSRNFLKDKEHLSFPEKRDRFERLNDLNPESKINTLHVKVGFDPSEKDMTNEKMAAIAERYMKEIGFSNQPYLVYRHKDTDIPHFHIVSTLIFPDGHRYRTNNIGRDKSEPARKALEKEFDLVRAEDHKQTKEYQLKPVDLEKIRYGEKPTKQAIQNTLRIILEEYKAGSLSELNAILRQYNMTADPGQPGSRTRQYQGLSYKVLDENGNTVGVPIKASEFYFKPTLKNLEGKFKKDKIDRKEDLAAVRAKIDWALHQSPETLLDLIAALKKENIDVVTWQNKEGQIYGMTYVDHRHKIVVKGSDLGKDYGAKPVLGKFQKPDLGQTTVSRQTTADQNTEEQHPDHQPSTEKSPGYYPPTGYRPFPGDLQPDKTNLPNNLEPELKFNSRVPHLLENLIRPEQTYNNTPYELRKTKKKRRRKSL